MRLITQSVEKVQRGTDRTAAELVLRRLKDEVQSITAETEKMVELEKARSPKLRGFLLFGVVPLAVVALASSQQSGSAGFVIFIFVIVASIGAVKMRGLIRSDREIHRLRQAGAKAVQAIEQEMDQHKALLRM